MFSSLAAVLALSIAADPQDQVRPLDRVRNRLPDQPPGRVVPESAVPGTPVPHAPSQAVPAPPKPQARTVRVELILAEVKPAKAEAEPAELTDANILARLTELAKSGEAQIERTRLIGIDGDLISANVSSSKPFVTNRIVNAGGAGPGMGAMMNQENVAYRDGGTSVKARAWVGADDLITIDLDLQVSHPPRRAAAGGPPEFSVLSVVSRVPVPSGKAVIVQANEKPGGMTTYVVLTARVSGGEPRAER